MAVTLIERIGVCLNPRKIHKLKLTSSFMELFVAFAEVLSGRLARSVRTEKLEEAFRRRFGAKAAVIFPHARTALHFILKAMNLEDGDEVLMTPMTIADMVNSIHTLGLKPVFVDIELDTYNFDMDCLEKSVTPRTRVIFVTYIFGVVPNMDKIREIARRYNLRIIEDCSQGFDASYEGKPLGAFGDAAFFSLTNFKVCSSLFGGMVITGNETMSSALVAMRDAELLPPQSSMLLKLLTKNLIYTVFFSRFLFSYFTYFIILLLENIDPRITYRLYSGNIKVLLGQQGNRLLTQFPPEYLADYTDAQAKVGLASLSRAGEVTSARIKNGDMLRELLHDIPDINVPVKLDGAVNVYWRFPVISGDMEGLKRFLLNNGIDSAQTYLTLCSKEPGFEPYHRPTPNAERLKNCVLVVEVNEDLSEHDVRRTAGLIRSYFKIRGAKNISK